MNNTYTVAIEFISKIENTLGGFNRLNAYCRQLNKNLNDVNDKYKHLVELQEKFNKASGAMISSGTKLAAVSGVMAAGATAAVVSYASLEEAQARLKMSEMDAAGAVTKSYQDMLTLGNKMGQTLPGETKDMVEMFIALRSQGIQAEEIIGGVGQSTANLAVVMGGLDYKEVAGYMGGLKNSLGIATKDMERFADIVQRVKYSAGVDLNELSGSLVQAGASMKNMGMEGIGAAESYAVLMGVLKKSVSLKDANAGESLKSAMTEMAMLPQKMKSGEGAQAKNILDQYGINLEFFKNGQFQGLENMVAQVQKLQALTGQERQNVLTSLFGDAGAKAMGVLAAEGTAGYQKMADTMNRQANIQTKINEYNKTTKMQWDAMTGTIATVFKQLGEGITKALHLVAVMRMLNSVIGKFSDFLERHKTLAKVFGAAFAAITLVVAALAGLLIAGGLIIGVASKMIWAFRTVRITWLLLNSTSPVLAAGLRSMAIGMWGAVKASIAFCFTPLGATLLAVAAGIVILVGIGYLLYKNWDKIVSLFKATVNVIKNIFSPMKKLSNGVLALIAVVFPFIGIPILIWKNWDKIHKLLVTGWDFVKTNWKKFLQVFLWTNPLTLPWMILNTVVKKIFGINLFQAGIKIIKTLWEGIKAAASWPVKAIGDMVWNMRKYLPFSPAKTGPFRDLHKVQIVQTIARAIVPGPAIEAMKTTMSVLAGGNYGLKPAAAGAGSSVRSNYNITVNLNINGPVSNPNEVAKNLKPAIEKVLKDIDADRMRRRY